MNVSLEYLRHCTNETGYRIEPLEKVVRLGEMADRPIHTWTYLILGKCKSL